jgi:ankyrin repeat protein
VLASLPKDLHATYERILSRLDGKQAQNVKLVLLVLAFSTQTMTKNQLGTILRINTQGKPRVRKIEIYWDRLLTTCSSLVSLSSYTPERSFHIANDDHSDSLRLAHFSVKEYLVSEHIKHGSARNFWLSYGMSHRVMAELCVSCLLHHDRYSDCLKGNLEQIWFTEYAADFWAQHAKEANQETERGYLDDLIFEFLHRGARDPYLIWCETRPLARTYYANRPSLHRRPQVDSDGRVVRSSYMKYLETGDIGSPLLLAAQHNLCRAVERLLVEGNDTDYHSHVLEAMFKGVESNAYESLEKLILLGGADPNSTYQRLGGDYQTLLHRCGRAQSSKRMIKLLMEHGADPHVPCPRYGTPIHYLSWHGCHDQLLALLTLGADPDVVYDGEMRGGDRDISLSTPLQCAAYRGHVACLDVLLKYGAAINRVEGEIGSCLHAAAVGGQREVFKHLLKKGADIRLLSKEYGSVLWAAGYGTNKEIVRICLEKGLSWADAIDPNLEKTRGEQWKNLDAETKDALVERVIELSGQRHCQTLADAVSRGLETVKAYLAKKELLSWDKADGMSMAARVDRLDIFNFLAQNPPYIDIQRDAARELLMFAQPSNVVGLAKAVLALSSGGDWLRDFSWVRLVQSRKNRKVALPEFFVTLETMPLDKREFEWLGDTYRMNPHHPDGLRYEKVQV